MGYDISQETWERIERNRREGRLCQGSSRCSVRATRLVQQRSWVYKIGEGESQDHPMVMCTRHANQYPPGYEGVNFQVLSVGNLPKGR